MFHPRLSYGTVASETSRMANFCSVVIELEDDEDGDTEYPEEGDMEYPDDATPVVDDVVEQVKEKVLKPLVGQSDGVSSPSLAAKWLEVRKNSHNKLPC